MLKHFFTIQCSKNNTECKSLSRHAKQFYVGTKLVCVTPPFHLTTQIGPISEILCRFF
jgi:hypothetical protein